jgi:hypothetical protein
MTMTGQHTYHHLWLELDGEAASGEEFAEIGMGWLDRGSRAMLGQARVLLDSDAKAPYREPDSPDLPWGPADGVWGRVHVARLREAATPRLTFKPANASGWRWLSKQLLDPPAAATAHLLFLDDQGFPIQDPARHLYLEARSHAQSPGWIRLCASMTAGTLGDEPHGRGQQQRWLSLLRLYADAMNPSFGQIGYNVAGGNVGATVLEDRLPVNFGRNSPEWTVGESRRYLRGYDWLTVLAQEHADRLGGVGGLAATGAFFEVIQLSSGGVWLRATEDWSDYDMAAAERVFRALAPVLRPGRPQPPAPNPLPVPPGREKRYLIVYEDAASVAGNHSPS